MLPLLWLGLCLDSGANRSGIMTATADIISGFEKDLLERASAEARAAPADNDADDEDEPAQAAQDEAAHAKRRKVQLRKKVAAGYASKPQLYYDEGSVLAIGTQMAQNSHRAAWLYDEGRYRKGYKISVVAFRNVPRRRPESSLVWGLELRA